MLHEVVEGLRGMLQGIESKLDAQCIVSPVTRCIATIDAVSALSLPGGIETPVGPPSLTGLTTIFSQLPV